MRLVAVLLGLVLVGCAAPSSATPSAARSAAATDALVDIGAGIQGPAGLAATVVAAGLPNVAALAVDDEGRIWAGTAAFDDAGTDTISVVATAGSVPRTVVRGLHTVLGLLWIDDALYVASKERVTVYRGFDGAAFASVATIVTFPAGVGEVNGLALGPDGRLYVGISAPCNACGTTLAESGSVVSFRVDGTDQRVVASGIRAPIGLAFVPGTTRLVVSMNQRDDLGDATPGDILGVVVEGQDWGFPACTGPGAGACSTVPTPLAMLDTHAAASGVAIVTGQFGASVGTAAVVAEWAKGGVLRASLDAATTVSAEPFLSGFTSPVAVTVDGSRALLVGDWGAGTIIRIATARRSLSIESFHSADT